MEISDCKVIVGGTAIGKTYLAKHDDRFVDLDNERAIYKYGLYDATPEELEYGKFNRGKVVHDDASRYTMKRILEELKKGKVVLLSYHKAVLNFLKNKEIPYCLVYAAKDSREEYIQRMRGRGNHEQFIDEITGQKQWDDKYDINVKSSAPTFKIELKKGQYLSDIKEMFFK